MMKTENIENRNGNKNETNSANHVLNGNGSAPPTSIAGLGTVNVETQIHTRNGKIARLPLEIREEVNQFLRSGVTYANIVSKLAELGHPGISINSISTWKHGGYIEWLREQQQADARLVPLQCIERCTRARGIDRLQQNALAMAADQLSLIMLKFDPNRALDILYQKPQLFPAFIAALSSLARCSSDLAKSFDLIQSTETSLRAETTDASPSFSSGERAGGEDACKRSSPSAPTNGVPILPLPEGEGRGEGEETTRTGNGSLRDGKTEMAAPPRLNLQSHSEPTQTNSDSKPPLSDHFQPILTDSE